MVRWHQSANAMNKYTQDQWTKQIRAQHTRGDVNMQNVIVYTVILWVPVKHEKGQ